MSPIFTKIVYFACDQPLDGAVQMALDELLLASSSSSEVILRDYLWAEPTTSVGYFGNVKDFLIVNGSKPPKSLLRRPTGGGAVEHGHGRDFTYTIVIGAGTARELGLAPRESYRVIHQVLRSVLAEFEIESSMAGDDESGAGGEACFVNPVGDDLMAGGKKLAGAGQKRSRGAILHQGSVQPVSLPAAFGMTFAEALGSEVEVRDLDPALLLKAERLAERKYRTQAWTRERRLRE